MKKEFVNPEIVIRRFDVEDIITDSGVEIPVGKSAQDIAGESIGVEKIYTTNWSIME